MLSIHQAYPHSVEATIALYYVAEIMVLASILLPTKCLMQERFNPWKASTWQAIIRTSRCRVILRIEDVVKVFAHVRKDIRPTVDLYYHLSMPGETSLHPLL